KSKFSFRLATYAHTYRLLIVNVQFSLSNHLGDLIADLSSAQKQDYEEVCSTCQQLFAMIYTSHRKLAANHLIFNMFSFQIVFLPYYFAHWFSHEFWLICLF
ncbi:hypothetical protein, partial [Formosimonas limnophila]|uniref:hypothetical protein n=1 Tax=Formosimonas limnophila TaxID=1384487 RepID=UPI001E535A06